MITTEMNKLIRLLVEEGIPFEVHPWVINGEATFQIASPTKKDCIVDAVCHHFSYGGEAGLIEVMGSANPNHPNDDVVGWLTAEKALIYFMKEDPKPCWPFIPFF